MASSLQLHIGAADDAAFRAGGPASAYRQPPGLALIMTTRTIHTVIGPPQDNPSCESCTAAAMN